MTFSSFFIKNIDYMLFEYIFFILRVVVWVTSDCNEKYSSLWKFYFTHYINYNFVYSNFIFEIICVSRLKLITTNFKITYSNWTRCHRSWQLKILNIHICRKSVPVTYSCHFEAKCNENRPAPHSRQNYNFRG